MSLACNVQKLYLSIRCITDRRTADKQVKSIGELRLAPCVREYIADWDSYDEAITVFQNLYTKISNEVFAHRFLGTPKQQPEGTLDKLYLTL